MTTKRVQSVAISETTRDCQVNATIRDYSYARPPAAELNHAAESWQGRPSQASVDRAYANRRPRRDKKRHRSHEAAADIARHVEV